MIETIKDALKKMPEAKELWIHPDDARLAGDSNALRKKEMKLFRRYVMDPIWEVLKYFIQIILCVGGLSLVIISPILPCLLAAEFGNWCLWLYIPLIILLGLQLKHEQ